MKSLLLRLLATCAVVAPTFGAQTAVHLSPSKSSSKRLEVKITSGVHAGLVSPRRGKWGKALRESALPSRVVEITVMDECPPALVGEFMEAALVRYGYDRLQLADGSRPDVAALAAVVQAEHGPLVLLATVLDPGTNRVGVRVDDQIFAPEDRAKLFKRMKASHEARPQQRWILDFNGLDMGTLAWCKGLPRELKHTRMTVRDISKGGERRWMAADAKPAIIELGLGGSIARAGDIFVSAEGVPSDLTEAEHAYADKYFGRYAGTAYEAAYMAIVRLVERSPKLKIHGRPTIEIAEKRLLIRAHPSTPWIHVERLMEIAAAVRSPRLNLALVTRPLAEAQALDLLVDHGALERLLDTDGQPVTAEPADVELELVQAGERIPMTTYSPFDGAPVSGWRFDGSRRVRFVLAGTQTESIAELRRLFRASKDSGAEFRLRFQCGPGITVADVLPLIQVANALGLGPLGIHASKTDPGDDYDAD